MNGLFSEQFNNGAGFPSFMCATFVNNDPAQDQRPGEFCGIQQDGTWFNASTKYNSKWFQYITSINDKKLTLELSDGVDYTMLNYLKIESDGSSSIKNIDEEQIQFRNYPNPFKTETEISFSILKKTNIRLSLFNVNGEEVQLLKKEEIQAGKYTVKLKRRDLKKGVYLFTLQIDYSDNLIRMVFID